MQFCWTSTEGKDLEKFLNGMTFETRLADGSIGLKLRRKKKV